MHTATGLGASAQFRRVDHHRLGALTLPNSDRQFTAAAVVRRRIRYRGMAVCEMRVDDSFEVRFGIKYLPAPFFNLEETSLVDFQRTHALLSRGRLTWGRRERAHTAERSVVQRHARCRGAFDRSALRCA